MIISSHNNNLKMCGDISITVILSLISDIFLLEHKTQFLYCPNILPFVQFLLYLFNDPSDCVI